MRMLFIITLYVLAMSCSRLKTVQPVIPTRYFVSGMYITEEEGRFFVARDTLIIAKRRTPSNQYLVTRLSGFQRSLEDEYFPVEHVKTEWSALYDENSFTLSGINKNANLRFIPELNGIQLYGTVYTRVE